MAAPHELILSDEQTDAFEKLAHVLAEAGIDLDTARLQTPQSRPARAFAVLGKAGSGKTLLLADLVGALQAAGVDLISGDWEGRRRRDRIRRWRRPRPRSPAPRPGVAASAPARRREKRCRGCGA